MADYDLTLVTFSRVTREATRVLLTAQELPTHAVTHKLQLTLDHGAGCSTGTGFPQNCSARVTGTWPIISRIKKMTKEI